ncbi:hypothetical protein OUZ56_022721 [Daphnia magna]|uniref:Uncharacterized protein n=1 Tax=Daphnia magna TaxID=35525 RepID=A0ABR0AX99_9CRUS|nr:hypothetical protein OUZ56_022721 [Daphnia magna]
MDDCDLTKNRKSGNNLCCFSKSEDLGHVSELDKTKPFRSGFNKDSDFWVRLGVSELDFELLVKLEHRRIS